MKAFSFLLALLLAGNFAIAQESDKTLVKSLNPEECPNVKIDIKNKAINAAPWDEGTIRVELEIKANVPEAVLSQLVKAGRYTIEGEKDGETYIVKAGNLDKVISIGGKDLEEEITITIKTPGYFAMNDAGVLSKDINVDVIAARAENAEEAARVLENMKKIKEDVNIQLNVVSTSRYKGEVDLSKFKMVVDGEEITADQLKF